MAQLYSVAEASKNETGGGEGVEVPLLKRRSRKFTCVFQGDQEWTLWWPPPSQWQVHQGTVHLQDISVREQGTNILFLQLTPLNFTEVVIWPNWITSLIDFDIGHWSGTQLDQDDRPNRQSRGARGGLELLPLLQGPTIQHAFSIGTASPWNPRC